MAAQVVYGEIRTLSTEWELDCQQVVDIPFITETYRFVLTVFAKNRTNMTI